MSSYSLTRSRTIQYVGILLALAAIAVGYWYFAVRAGVKTNTSGSQPQGAGDLSAGLAGYWKLDENTGTSASDASTNGNTGTLTNGPTWVTGQIGSAVDFDGTNDYVSAGTAATPIVTDKKTVAAWVYVDGTMTNGERYQIVRKYSSGDSNSYYGLSLFHDGSSVRLESFQGGGGAFIYSTGAVAAGQWVHVAATFDKPNVSFYINGVLDSTGTDTVAGGYPSGAGTMYIGSTDSGTGYFNGKLDEIRVYDRPLSSDEVTSLYRLTAPTGVDTGLKGYWSFDGGALSGTTAYDRSGAGNNGTLTNGPTVTDGRVGQALNFDGTNDYVDAGGNASLQSSVFTYVAWINPSGSGSRTIKGNSNNGPHFRINTSGVPQLIKQNVVDIASSTSSVSNGVWSHVVVTYDASGNYAFYVNGAPAGSGTNLQTFTFSNVQIGIMDSIDEMFSGSIDEFRMYNRVLSATEVKSLYDRGSADKANTSAGQAAGTGNLNSGLAGYWKLDENTGTSAADASTNGNTGTLTNGPTWTTGQIGSGVNFDGTDDYIALPSSSAFDLSGTDLLTVSLWVRLESFAAVGEHTTPFSFTDSGQTSSTNYDKAIQIDSSGNPSFWVYDGGVQTSYGASNISLNNWYHLAGTFDGTSVYLYVNGVRQAGDTATGSEAGSQMPVVGFVASAGWSSAKDPLDGQVDEVRVYDRSLSQDEVAQLYRLTAPTSVDTGLKGYWSLNGSDISGTTAYDRSGAGNNGTLTNGPTIKWGRVGQALEFDGTNDYVSMGDINALDGLTTTSWSAWIKTTATAEKHFMDKSFCGGTSGDGPVDFGVNFATVGKLAVYLANGSSVSGVQEGKTDVNDGVWHMATFTYDGSTTLIYVDGRLDATAAWAGGALTSTANAVEVGGNCNGHGGLFWPGQIDEARAYSRVLSAAEIKVLYDRSAPDKTNTSVSTPQGTGRLDSGLTGYWKLDENTGTSAGDASSAGTTGTLTGGPTWTTGQIGSAVDFDGTNDYIDLGTPAVLDVEGAHTVSAWVKTDVTNTDQSIFSSGTAGCCGTEIFLMLDHNGGGGYYDFQFGHGGSGYLDAHNAGDPDVQTGTWYHVVGTWDGAGARRFYVNGVLRQSDSISSLVEYSDVAKIGASEGGIQFWNGAIDEVRLYNRALSPDEVGQLYQVTAPTGTDTGLKGYWSFNGQDVSGTTAYDRSGSGNDGTLTNGPTIKWGKLGQALQFDGTNDYVDAGSVSTLDNLSTLSVSGWFNQASCSSGFCRLVGKGYGISSPISGWHVVSDITGGGLKKIGFLGVFSGTNLLVQPSSTFSENEWNHFAITWDGSTNASNVHIYLNGVETGYTTQTNATGTYDSDASESLQIGGFDGTGESFNGKIDEVRVYNRILSASEIKALYSSGK